LLNVPSLPVSPASFGAIAPAAMALDSYWGTETSWWNLTNVVDDDELTYFKRIAGSDRYETMKKIVKSTYNLTGDKWYAASVAVVASGDNFPDALAANGLAGALNGGEGAPVILTNKGKLNSHAKELLTKLQVQTVYIMGGTAAVTQEVEDAIRDMHIATIRVAGADRQATSVQAFNLIDGNWYKKHGTHSVIIATGANYADALSIAPFAYATGTPIILTKADGTLTDEAVKAIKGNDEIWQVIVVGGNAVVADSVFSVLGTYSGSYRDYYNKVYIPVRIAGADRYDTSAKIADWECNFAFNTGSDAVNGYNLLNKNLEKSDIQWADFGFDEVFVATGENFPDALAGGQIAGGKYYAKGAKHTERKYAHAPILLTKDGNRSADAMIAQHLAWNKDVYSVNSMVYANFMSYFKEIYPKVWGTNAWYEALEEFIEQYMYDGFSTKTRIYFDSEIDLYDGPAVYDLTEAALTEAAEGEEPAIEPLFHALPADGIDVAAVNRQYRVKNNNFHGIILGGRAAVSHDKAKQLDDTVEGSIKKYYDADAYDTYHLWYDGANHTWKIINSNNYEPSMWNTQTVTGVYPNSGFYNNNTLVKPIYGGFNYWYVPTITTPIEATYSKPYGLTKLGYTYKVDFVGFDSDYDKFADVALYVTVDGSDNLIRADFLPSDGTYLYDAVANCYYME
jgi:putative cell wall-binding protein